MHLQTSRSFYRLRLKFCILQSMQQFVPSMCFVNVQIKRIRSCNIKVTNAITLLLHVPRKNNAVMLQHVTVTLQLNTKLKDNLKKCVSLQTQTKGTFWIIKLLTFFVDYHASQINQLTYMLSCVSLISRPNISIATTR